jgi:hypothetical protein
MAENKVTLSKLTKYDFAAAYLWYKAPTMLPAASTVGALYHKL